MVCWAPQHAALLKTFYYKMHSCLSRFYIGLPPITYQKLARLIARFKVEPLSLQGVDLTLRTIIITATLGTITATSGCSTMGFNKQQTGTAAGAVVGGIVGSAVTGGSTVGTVAGAAGGAVVGNQIGKKLDKVK